MINEPIDLNIMCLEYRISGQRYETPSAKHVSQANQSDRCDGETENVIVSDFMG